MNLKLAGLAGISVRFLLLTTLLLNPALWTTVFAETEPVQSVSLQTETATKPENQPKHQDVDELLKNFMASMSYSPKAVALPADPEPYPSLALISPGLGPNDFIPGSDTHADLPEPPETTPKKPLKAPKTAKLNFMKPVLNAILSSSFGNRWGRMHEGVDLAVPQGTPIQAVEAGKVIYSGWASGYGNFVSVDHGSGYVSRYGHASSLLVRSGQKVKKGQIIALVGSTGHSTGPHLHFEIVNHGRHQNPLPMLNKTITLSIHQSGNLD